MRGRFRVMIRGEIREFEEFDDIPRDIDTVISFRPEYPPPPHTDEDHALIDTFGAALDDLLARGRKR